MSWLIRAVAERDAALALAKRSQPSRTAWLPAARPRSQRQAVRPRRAVRADAAHHNRGALWPVRQSALRTGASVQPRGGAVAREAACWRWRH